MSALLRWGLQLRVWVALCVASLSAFSGWALFGLGYAHQQKSITVVFLSTLALYNLDGTLDAGKGQERRTRRRLHVGVSVAATLTLLFCLAGLPARAALFVLLGLVVCSAYAVPILEGRVRLKSVPGVKAPFVGASVACASIGVPSLAALSPQRLAAALQQETSFVVVLLAVLTLCCTTNAILFDLPDIREDARLGVPTLARRFPLRKTQWLCTSLTASAGLLVSWAMSQLQMPRATHALGALLVLSGALTIMTWCITKHTPKATVAWWVDGALLLPLAWVGVRGMT
jgi:4-hydroxybenzoate polyprenyltransferase